MIVNQALAAAVSGIEANARKANAAANNIVNQNTPGFAAERVRAFGVVTAGTPARGGGVRVEVFNDGVVDVATEFTRLIEAEIAYRAAAKALATAAEIERRAVDLIA